MPSLRSGMTDPNENAVPTQQPIVTRRRFGAVISSCASRRWFPWLVLVVICVLAVLLRCLHLLQADYHYILSPDSHLFHRMADLVASGDEYFYPTHNRILPYWLTSGVTYPVGLLAKALAFATGMASPDAVATVSKCLPPAISVLSIVVLWLVVSRMYGRNVAHLSAFAWAVSHVAVFFGAAGYLDRDGISLLLVMMGVSVFYLMKEFRLKIRGMEFGWLMRGASVLVFEVLLFVEWGWLGPVILLAVLAAYVVCEVAAKIWPRLVTGLYAEEDIMMLPFTLLNKGVKSILPAIRESSYKPLLFVLALSALGVFFRSGVRVSMYNQFLAMFQRAPAGAQSVGELQGIGPGDIIGLQFLLVPLVIGLYVIIRKRRTPDILWLGWFAVLFIGGLFARRLFHFATPAICVLCGIGLAAMLDVKVGRRFSLGEFAAGVVGSRIVLRYVKAAATIFLIGLTLIVSVWSSYNLGPRVSRALAVTPEWKEALMWMRENTPDDGEAKVMTWWDYGYWILDVAHRVPVVDNGIHRPTSDRDIARVYCTENDTEAVEIMQEYSARYLVFSEIEIELLPVISLEALGTAYGDMEKIPPELRNSLFSRSLAGQTEFGGGLRRVYPGPDVEDPTLVILALE